MTVIFIYPRIHVICDDSVPFLMHYSSNTGEIWNFSLIETRISGYVLYMMVQANKYSVLLEATEFLLDIFAWAVLMQLVDWSTQLEKDENWRLLHYQKSRFNHWPLWIVQSRDTLDLCWHRYKLPALICLSGMEQETEHYAFHKRILSI